jgi:hypothetical protein
MKRHLHLCLIVAAAGSASAQVLFDQPLNPTYLNGGMFSILSGQQFADDFVPLASGTVDAVSWWGSFYQRQDPFNTGAIWTFHARIFADAAGLPGTMLMDAVVSALITETIYDNSFGSRIYRFDASVSGPTLAAGTEYHFSVVDSNVGGPFSNIFLTQPVAYGMGSIRTGDNDPTWANHTSGRGEMGYVIHGIVPEPGTLAALALGAATLLRRRRK